MRRTHAAQTRPDAGSALRARKTYKVALKDLVVAIAQEKAKVQDEWIAVLDRDLWGRLYREVMNTLCPWAPPLTKSLDPGFVEEILGALFPPEWGAKGMASYLSHYSSGMRSGRSPKRNFGPLYGGSSGAKPPAGRQSGDGLGISQWRLGVPPKAGIHGLPRGRPFPDYLEGGTGGPHSQPGKAPENVRLTSQSVCWTRRGSY